VSLSYYLPLSALCILTLLTTLKLTLTGRVTIGQDKKTFILFHPIWLGPLVVMVPFVIGHYLEGKLSPWPIAAFTATRDHAGLWAGILAGTATATIDLWLFWTTASALLTFTEPMSTVYEPIPKSMHKYYHLVNLAAGAFVIFKALSRHAD